MSGGKPPSPPAPTAQGQPGSRGLAAAPARSPARGPAVSGSGHPRSGRARLEGRARRQRRRYAAVLLGARRPASAGLRGARPGAAAPRARAAVASARQGLPGAGLGWLSQGAAASCRPARSGCFCGSWAGEVRPCRGRCVGVPFGCRCEQEDGKRRKFHI